MYHGVVVIITDPARRRYIMQRKDNRHPKPEVRRALCFWGGGIEDGETPREAAERELAEEIRFELPLSGLRHFWTAVYPAVQWPGDYGAHVFELIISDDRFDDLAAGLPVEYVAEGIGEVCSLELLVSLAIADPLFFVASHGEVFLRYVMEVGEGNRGDGDRVVNPTPMPLSDFMRSGAYDAATARFMRR